MVHRRKDNHSGAYPLQPDEAKAIQAWLCECPQPPSPVLFPSNYGDPIARRALDWLMKKYGEIAALPVAKRHFHCLKHSIATHLLEAGAALRWSIERMMAEMRESRPGASLAANQLAYLMLLQALRLYGSRQAGSQGRLVVCAHRPAAGRGN